MAQCKQCGGQKSRWEECKFCEGLIYDTKEELKNHTPSKLRLGTLDYDCICRHPFPPIKMIRVCKNCGHAINLTQRFLFPGSSQEDKKRAWAHCKEYEIHRPNLKEPEHITEVNIKCFSCDCENPVPKD